MSPTLFDSTLILAKNLREFGFGFKTVELSNMDLDYNTDSRKYTH